MTYRDEKEALRARVDELEEENRELREKLAPKPPPPPEPEPAPAAPPAIREPEAFDVARAVKRAGSIAAAALLLGTCGYFGSVDVRALVWRGTTTFECPLNSSTTMRGKTARLATEPAIAFDVNCEMRVVHCDLAGTPAITMSVNNKLQLEHSRVRGDLVLGTNSVVVVTDSTIEGEISPLDARIVGLTDLPLGQVTKTPSAVAPLALVDAAVTMARLGSGARLVGMEVIYVGATGEVDLTASDYAASIVYEVEAPLPSVEPPAATPSSRPGLPPPPPPPAPARRTFKTIRVDGKGMRVASGVKDPQEARVSVAAPGCAIADLWRAARAAGAPANGVARIRFSAPAPATWSFELDGTDHKFEAQNDGCELKRR